MRRLVLLFFFFLTEWKCICQNVFLQHFLQKMKYFSIPWNWNVSLGFTDLTGSILFDIGSIVICFFWFVFHCSTLPLGSCSPKPAGVIITFGTGFIAGLSFLSVLPIIPERHSTLSIPGHFQNWTEFVLKGVSLRKGSWKRYHRRSLPT